MDNFNSSQFFDNMVNRFGPDIAEETKDICRKLYHVIYFDKYEFMTIRDRLYSINKELSYYIEKAFVDEKDESIIDTFKETEFDIDGFCDGMIFKLRRIFSKFQDDLDIALYFGSSAKQVENACWIIHNMQYVHPKLYYQAIKKIRKKNADIADYVEVGFVNWERGEEFIENLKKKEEFELFMICDDQLLILEKIAKAEE